MGQSKPLDRTTLESWVHQPLGALETKDMAGVTTGLHPDICWVWGQTRWQGHQQLQAGLEQSWATWGAVRFHARHLLIDVARENVAVEWVCRYGHDGLGQSQEVWGGTVLVFDQAGLLCRCRTYLDPVRSRTSSDLDEPWPKVGWTASQTPGPAPDRAVAEQLIQANARAWSSHDVAQLSRVIHDEICLCPPWDYQVGRTNVEKGAQIYFANYQDTQVTPQRIIFDPTQPYFGVCEQTFACVNPETGRRGEDSDFAFFEIAQGKLRYWRTYFDTTNSVQVIEKTAGFLQQ